MTMTEIKAEIPRLTLREKLELARELDVDGALWDAQMLEDSKPGGKLRGLAEEALAEHKRGETLPDCP
ncbi:MAG: hypothetical protein LBM92_00435 [Opitutaceae bacterium]|jgi:hypothetical protein|nr:hypothetical protein [Opitutaceae bacterium]